MSRFSKISERSRRYSGTPRLSNQAGVAMMSAVLIAAVLLILGAGIFLVASRETRMSSADNAGGQAFSYAEGGIENVLDTLSYTASEYQLTQLRADQSGDGYGYLMDPDPDLRQTPSNPVEMQIAGTHYTVYVDEVDSNGDHCSGCGLNVASNTSSYLMVTAQSQSGQGYRMLRQMVMISPSSYPLTLYINGNANIGGNTTIQNQSIYVRGDVYGRAKLTISGYDTIFGGHAGVFATGAIFAKQNGGSSQIYTSTGEENLRYWDSNYQYDRDSRGPTGHTFSQTDLENVFSTGGMLPGGLTTSQLTTLKSMAQNNGYYNVNPGNGMTISQNDVPSRGGDLVVYVEFPSGDPTSNTVDLKFSWPPSGYSDGKVLVIVRNGAVKMTGSAIGNTYGVIYCPDGPVTADGSGGGNFTGFVWGNGLVDIGNFNFNLTSQAMNDPPFFAWTVSRVGTWEQVDR